MRQRGAVSPDLIIAGAVVLLLVGIFSAGAWYVDRERKAAFAAGETAERARWQARENEEVRMANAAWRAAQAHASQLEQQAALDLVALEEEKDKEVADAKEAADRFVADVHAGRVRLFDPFQGRDTPCQQAGGDAAREAPAGAAERDAQTDLRRAYAERVARSIQLADEADSLIREAQGVIEVDRRTCK